MLVTPDDRSHFVEICRRAKLLAVDTETTGLSWRRDRVLGASVATSDATFYIPIDDEGAIVALDAALNTPSTKVFHNAKFDLHFLAGLNNERRCVTVGGPVEDLLIASWLVDENDAHGLKALGETYLEVETTDLRSLLVAEKARRREVVQARLDEAKICASTVGREERSRLSKWWQTVGISDIPVVELAEYAEQDARLTYDLWVQHFTKYLKDEGQEKVYRQLCKPLSGVLWRMERRGVRIDLAEAARLRGEFETELLALEGEIASYADGDINVRSNQQLVGLLYGKMRLPVVAMTDAGEPSVDADALKELYIRKRHPILKALLTYRGLQKLLDTYLVAEDEKGKPKGMLGAADDGVISTDFKLTGTKTGRLSSAGPNLQNIPRKGRGAALRRLFTAREGCTLVCADLSQAEPRYLAHISGDERLRAVFAEGRDIYTDFAGPLGITRDQAKVVLLATSYGMGPGTLKTRLYLSDLEKPVVVSLDAASHYLEGFYQTYPQVRQWQRQQLRQAGTRGYVETYSGRRRRLPELRYASDTAAIAAARRQAINAPIQGSVADFVGMAMVQLDEELRRFGAHLLLQVHDELLIEAPTAEAKEVLSKTIEVLENVADLAAPLRADAHIGENWAVAKGG